MRDQPLRGREANQLQKALRFERHFRDRGFDGLAVHRLTPSQWETHARLAGENSPSEITRGMVIMALYRTPEEVRRREHGQAAVA